MPRNTRSRHTHRQSTGGSGTVVIGGGSAIWSAFGGREDKKLAEAQASIQNTSAKNSFEVGVSADMSNRHVTRASIQPVGASVTTSQSVSQKTDAEVQVSEIRLLPAPFSPTDDLYLSQGQGDTNFGSAETLLSKQSTPVGNNAQIAYIAFDLTGIDTGTITSMDLFLTQVTSAVAAQNVQVQVYTAVSKPFEEGTGTWNGDEQPVGTLRQTLTQQVPTGAAQEIQYVLSSGVRASAKGRWLFFRITSTDALGISTVSTNSKESSTGQPRLELEQTL